MQIPEWLWFFPEITALLWILAGRAISRWWFDDFMERQAQSVGVSKEIGRALAELQAGVNTILTNAYLGIFSLLRGIVVSAAVRPIPWYLVLAACGIASLGFAMQLFVANVSVQARVEHYLPDAKDTRTRDRLRPIFLAIVAANVLYAILTYWAIFKA